MGPQQGELKSELEILTGPEAGNVWQKKKVRVFYLDHGDNSSIGSCASCFWAGCKCGYRHNAALLVLDQGYSVIEASKSLGIGETALRRWVDQLRIERDGGTPKGKALTPEQQKIQELEARVNRLEREKAILKKATALLMADELDRSR